MRTSKNLWFLDLALRCAQQGTCMRRNYGSVIVDCNNHVISTGYTGAPCNQPHCGSLGFCWREQNNIPSGSNYNKCRSVHSEANALLQAGSRSIGCTLFLAGVDAKSGNIVHVLPCYLCSKMIVNAGISTVVVLKRQPLPTDEVSKLEMANHYYSMYTPTEILRIREKEELG